MKGRVLITGLVLLCLGQSLRAQQDWSWVFGDSVLMRFHGGGAPVVDSLARTRWAFESMACISDSSGNLLYYTDESWLYRADGTKVPGGVNLIANYLSNGLQLLPVWGGPEYMLFYVGSVCQQAGPCMRYSLIEGLPGNENVALDQGLGSTGPLYGIVEKVSAVRDAPGTGWWVLYHGFDDKFYRIRVEGNRLSPFTIQQIGSSHGPVVNNWSGYNGELCFAPNGDKLLVVAGNGVIDIFDFDRCTGVLSNWDTLGTPAPNYPGPDCYYGCAFSPDGTKVYVAESTEAPFINHLYQWDLNAPNIRASRTLIHTMPDSVTYGALQLGPDGKIYVANESYYDSLDPSNFYLSVIHNPNATGPACDFRYLDLHLKGLRGTGGLPNLANYNLPPMVRQVAEAGPARAVCPGDSVRIGYPDSTGGAVVYSWAPWTGLEDPNSPYTWAKPAVTTRYYLTAYDTAMGMPCGQTVDSVLVYVVPSSEMPGQGSGAWGLGPDTTLCAGDSLGLGIAGFPGWDYRWSTGDSSQGVTVVAGGTYSVIVTNDIPSGPVPSSSIPNLGCLVASDTVVVGAFPAPGPLSAGFAGGDTVACIGDSVHVGTGTGQGWDYLWSPPGAVSYDSAGQGWVVPTVTQAYWLTATDSASGGRCWQISDTILITVPDPTALPVNWAGQDTSICAGDSVVLGQGAGGLWHGWLISWSPGIWLSDSVAAQPIAVPQGDVVYTATAADSASGGRCLIEMDSVRLMVEGMDWVDGLNLFAMRDTSVCPGECLMIGVQPTSGLAYRWSPTTGLSSPNTSMTRAQPASTIAYTLTITNPAISNPNCREAALPLTVTVDACDLQTFIAVNGNNVAEVLDLGSHAAPVRLRVWDMMGKLVHSDDDYKNDWGADGLARGMYVYRVSVDGDCPASHAGRIIVVR